MYSTHFLYCLITLIVEDLSAYAYFFIEKKVGAERTRIWTVTLAPQNKLQNLNFSITRFYGLLSTADCAYRQPRTSEKCSPLLLMWRRRGKNASFHPLPTPASKLAGYNPAKKDYLQDHRTQKRFRYFCIRQILT